MFTITESTINRIDCIFFMNKTTIFTFKFNEIQFNCFLFNVFEKFRYWMNSPKVSLNWYKTIINNILIWIDLNFLYKNFSIPYIILNYACLEVTKMLHNSSFKLDLLVLFLIISQTVTYGPNFNHLYFKNIYVYNTVDPVYSERGYSKYPVIVNGFLRTDH